jgi:hypothetical protein
MFTRIFLIFLLLLPAARAENTDFHHVERALRAMKMTPHDLSFKKNHADSELVLQKSRAFLQQPLALPAHGHYVFSNLQTTTSLSKLADFSREQLEIKPLAMPASVSAVPLDGNFLEKLPPAVARAAQKIVNAAAEAYPLLQEALPPDKISAFSAFAADNFAIELDKTELESWEELERDTRKLREILRRADNLELQDDELADKILEASDHFDAPKLFAAFKILARAVDDTIADLQTNKFTEEFEYSLDTPLGKIICGGVGKNVYRDEAFLIVDMGGDDVYENSAGGANGLIDRPISIVIDVGGNDSYASRRSFSQGAGVFGIGILADLGGDDNFVARHFSQGAGFFGIGALIAGAGKQSFDAETFAQGAGFFGAGILWQRGGGDTHYNAHKMAQGFGGVRGFGLLLDENGDDVYIAGGKYPCGWLPNQFFSLAQGFAIGMRPWGGGGVGILCDLRGNDSYQADVYGQGASYWYSVGMLLDGAGDDVYDAYQYAQGAGIHLSSGLLMDKSGDDRYTAHAICQGAAHDFSVGILYDLAGNDRYTGVSTAQGSAINASVALLLDASGNDIYTGEDASQSQAAGHDGGRREQPSIAMLLDLGGKDKFSTMATDKFPALKPNFGVVFKTESEFVGQALRLPRPKTMAGDAPVLQSTRRPRETVDVNHPIEQLLRRAISDKPDAQAAWDELKNRGAEVLPYLLTRVDSPNVLVRVRAEDLVDFLGTNAVPALISGMETAKNDDVARICAYFLARFESATNAIPHVLPLLSREKTRATALYALGHLRAREAVPQMLSALNSTNELVRLRAAQALGKIGDRRAVPALIRALDDEFFHVRYAAMDSLVKIGPASRRQLVGARRKSSPLTREYIDEALKKLRTRKTGRGDWIRTSGLLVPNQAL